MSDKQWYWAHIRWTVLGDSEEGTHHEEAVHIFLSEDATAASERAYRIRLDGQHCHYDGRQWVETRIGEVLAVDGLDHPELDVLIGAEGRRICIMTGR